VINDPEVRGRALGSFYVEVVPRLWVDLVEAGVLPKADDEATVHRARIEFECFMLYACVRGLVAAGGFNRETGGAIDALHEAVLEQWMSDAADVEAFQARRALVAERYSEYGEIGQQGGASGAETVTERLGLAAARHMTLEPAPADPLAELVGALHETLVEGSAEAVRIAEI
jgi:hypothetical protein